MENNAKVTIVIPVYNVEEYIEECLDSITNQIKNPADIEIICVEDCSTDNSAGLLRKYADNSIYNIRIIHNVENRGLSFSRNVGLNAATGDYLWFVDSDDIILDDSIYSLYKVAQDSGVDVVYFNLYLIANEGYKDKLYTYYCTTGRYPFTMTSSQFAQQMVTNGERRAPAWLQFWKRESLQKINISFHEGIYHEDELFLFQTLIRVEKVAFVNQAFYGYRQREGSIITKGVSPEHVLSLIKIYQIILGEWFHMVDSRYDSFAEMYISDMDHSIRNKYEKLEEENQKEFRKYLSASERFIFEKLLRKRYVAKKEILQKRGLNSLYDRIIDSSSIVIYGAGNYGKTLYRYLVSKEVDKRIRFAVTVKNENEFIYGIECEQIDKMNFTSEELIIVAVGIRLQDEIKKKLSELSLTNYVVLNSNMIKELREIGLAIDGNHIIQ